jgi:hypothetical protein
MLFRALVGCCGVCGALSTSSTLLTETDRLWGGFVGDSGVMTDSLGVETAEGSPDLFEFAARPNKSPSGFVADLITF